MSESAPARTRRRSTKTRQNEAAQAEDRPADAALDAAGGENPGNSIGEDRGDLAEADPASEVEEIVRARALLAQDEQNRTEKCRQELQEVLDRHGMTLQALGVLQLTPR